MMTLCFSSCLSVVKASVFVFFPKNTKDFYSGFFTISYPKCTQSALKYEYRYITEISLSSL